MKTRRQFLGLLAGLPLVGRLFGEENQNTIADGGFVLPEQFSDEICVTRDTVAGIGDWYYIFWDEEGNTLCTDQNDVVVVSTFDDATNTFWITNNPVEERPV